MPVFNSWPFFVISYFGKSNFWSLGSYSNTHSYVASFLCGSAVQASFTLYTCSMATHSVFQIS